LGEENVECVSGRERLRLVYLLPCDVYVAAFRIDGDLRIGRCYGAWWSDIDSRREIVATVDGAAEENTLGVCLAACRDAAAGASRPDNIKNVVTAAGIDGNLRPRRREAGQIDGECEIGNGIAVEGLAGQDVFGGRLIRPEKMDMASYRD
jgi:hypothetical protein